MAIDLIRPKNLPASGGVNADASIPADSGATVEKATPRQIVDAGRPIASESQAVAGTDNQTAMTPLTTRQAIDSADRIPRTYGDMAEAEAGTSAFPNESFVRINMGNAVLQAVASGGTITNAGGQGFIVVSGPRFNQRTAAAAAEIALYPDGTIAKMAGLQYVSDSSVLLADSAGADVSVAGVKPYGDVARLSQFGAAAGATVAANTNAMQRWAKCGSSHLVCDVRVSVEDTGTFDPALTWKFSCENRGKLIQTANNTNTIYGSGTYSEVVIFEDYTADGKGATDTASCANGDYFTSTARAIGVLVEKVQDVVFIRCKLRKHKNCGAMGNLIKGSMHVWDCYGIGTHDIGSVDADIPLGSTGDQQFLYRLGSHVNGFENWRGADDDPYDDEETGAGHNGGGLIVDGCKVGGTAIGIYASPGYRSHSIKRVTMLNDYPFSQHPIYIQAGDEDTYIGQVTGRGMYGVVAKLAAPKTSRRYPARNVLVEHISGETQDGSPIVSLEGNDKSYAGYDGTTYANTGDGLAATSDGEMFRVGSTVYLNDTGSAVSQGAFVDSGNGPSGMCILNPVVRNIRGMGDQSWLLSARNCLDLQASDLAGEVGRHSRAAVELLYSSGTIDGIEAEAVGHRIITGTLPIAGDLTVRNVDVDETEKLASGYVAVSFTEAGEAAPIIGSQYWWRGNIGQINNAIYRCTETGITASKVSLGTGTSEQTSGTAKFLYLGDKTTMTRGRLSFDGFRVGYSPSTAYMIDANLSKTTISYDGIDIPTSKQTRLGGLLGRRGSYKGGRLAGSLTVVNYESQEGDYLLSTTAGNYSSAPAWVLAHYWNRGQRIIHPNPTIASIIGFVCTSSGVGTASKWATIKSSNEVNTSGVEI